MFGRVVFGVVIEGYFCGVHSETEKFRAILQMEYKQVSKSGSRKE